MDIGEISNIVCLIKLLVCLENFNPWMNSPKKIKSEWMFAHSKLTTAGDKNITIKYYDMVRLKK